MLTALRTLFLVLPSYAYAGRGDTFEWMGSWRPLFLVLGGIVTLIIIGNKKD